MKLIQAVLCLAAASAVEAASIDTAKTVGARQSGCYAFEDPDCGIDYAVCQCANGWFYEYNPDSDGGCNPPWGILSTSESGLGGYSC